MPEKKNQETVTLTLTVGQIRMLRQAMDNMAVSALTIYDVAKALPHPYNAVGDMANHWAHDYINYIKHFGKTLDKAIQEES